MLQPKSDQVRSLAATLVALTTLLAAAPERLQGQSYGETVFKTVCVACHTLTSERLIGPGLQGIGERRDGEWLLAFITEPDRMLVEGDSIATRLLEEYLLPMPNLGTTRAQAEAVLEYITEVSAAAANAAPASPVSSQPEAPAAYTEEQVLLGQSLFQGGTRLTNGGPTCNACHDVTHDAVIGGGILAVELTTVFSRLGGLGVRAILGAPPFPVMQRAYADKPLTDDEVIGLVAFLQQADAEQALHQPRDYGIRLFGAGAVGSLFLLGLFSVMWRGRKRGSVNQAIFDRQIRTS